MNLTDKGLEYIRGEIPCKIYFTDKLKITKNVKEKVYMLTRNKIENIMYTGTIKHYKKEDFDDDAEDDEADEIESFEDADKDKDGSDAEPASEAESGSGSEAEPETKAETETEANNEEESETKSEPAPADPGEDAEFEYYSPEDELDEYVKEYLAKIENKTENADNK